VQHETAEMLKRLLKIPDTHEVLFLQGGASMQFALLPMNFLHPGKSADYVVCGVWGAFPCICLIRMWKATRVTTAC
jgi:phosphoserine aminotransferase